MLTFCIGSLLHFHDYLSVMLSLSLLLYHYCSFGNIPRNYSIDVPPPPAPHPKKIRFIGLRGWYTHTYGICAPFYCISQKIYILEGWGGYNVARGLNSWDNVALSCFQSPEYWRENIFCIWAHQYHDSGMRITSNIAKVCAIMFA